MRTVVATQPEQVPRIRVTCTAAGTLSLGSFKPLQGNLKSLSEQNFQKLKKSILRYGISFPLFAWRNGQHIYTLDGHQRDIVLQRMSAEGHEIPDVPVAWIEAVDKKEAKEKILLLSSQYGEMTDDSLAIFLDDAGISLPDLRDMVELPWIDMEGVDEEPASKDSDSSECFEYRVIVDCRGEGHQAELLERFEMEGLPCRALIT